MGLDTDNERPRISDLDELRFGIRVARVSRLTTESLPTVLSTCRESGVLLLIARCSCADFDTVHSALDRGFLLVDTQLIYKLRLDAEPPIRECPGIFVRSRVPGDADQVERIAREAFRDYCGHYHNDPRLDRAASTEVYASWAKRSCVDREVADEVLMAEVDEGTVGFVALKLKSDGIGEITLNAVHPEAQRGGVYGVLAARSLRWFHQRGVRHVVTSTHIANTGPQKVWCRMGFEPCSGAYTFHAWLDKVC